MTRFIERAHPDEYGFNTGGMLALLPDVDHAAAMAHPHGLPADELHVTLAYFGDDITRWPVPAAAAAEQVAAHVLAGDALPLHARAFAHATFNPDGGPAGDRTPCGVHLIGDSDRITALRDRAVGLAGAYLAAAGVDMPVQHEPFIPHITAGWGLNAASLHYTGPVRFDRLVLALGPRWIEVLP